MDTNMAHTISLRLRTPAPNIVPFTPAPIDEPSCQKRLCRRSLKNEFQSRISGVVYEVEGSVAEEVESDVVEAEREEIAEGVTERLNDT